MKYRSLSALLHLLLFAVLSTACSAQSQDASLESLRMLTKDSKLPSESVVTAIETKNSGNKVGALARLLRARVRFENRDFAGAAALLDSEMFAERTRVADYALWLRGQALQRSGDHTGALAAFEELINKYPASIRANGARTLWAASAISKGDALRVPGFLSELIEANEPAALLATAKAYESLGDQPNATSFYRRTYFYGGSSDEAKEAEAKLTAMSQALTPSNAVEIRARAERLYKTANWAEAEKSFEQLAANFPASLTPEVSLLRLATLARNKKMSNAQAVFAAIPSSAPQMEEAFYELVTGYARARLWADARRTANEMKQAFPTGKLTPRAWVDAGMAARDAKVRAEEQYFLRSALTSYPKAIEVAQAQFELAWLEHESKDFARSAQMLTEHLARYVDKDTTNRGKAGYWAARDSERAGLNAEACVLYDAVNYRYSANWYGYIGQQRKAQMEVQGKCPAGVQPPNEMVAKAAANLKTVTVAAETSGPRENALVEKSDELSIIGLFDWAADELNDAKRTAQNSPKINLALARHYRFKGDNVNALLALAKSYPDYSQMFPEEMGREEWAIFYPLIHWNDIKYWANERRLDPYQVAGLIRQESVFNPRARSHANAYGLMQLLVPTASLMARKYSAGGGPVTSARLFEAPLNIQLGTAYMRDQLDKFGRIEYMAVAYNAGPGRVPQWRATLPIEIDEFVEAIPFRETKGYVQGVIRNSAQYRRLYDESGNFKENVGARPLRGEIEATGSEEFARKFPEVLLDGNKGAAE